MLLYNSCKYILLYKKREIMPSNIKENSVYNVSSHAAVPNLNKTLQRKVKSKACLEFSIS